MAKLELEVEDTRGEQRVHVRCAQPLEEAAHDLGDVGSRSAGMDQDIPIENADIAGAKATGVRDEAIHHHAVDSQQFLHRVGVKAGNEVVGCTRVLYFENVTPVAKDPFSVDNRAHRMFIELVPFDNKRGIDRLNPQLPTQRGTSRQWGLRREGTDEFRDLYTERVDYVTALERWFVSHEPSYYRHIIPPLAVIGRRLRAIAPGSCACC